MCLSAAGSTMANVCFTTPIKGLNKTSARVKLNGLYNWTALQSYSKHEYSVLFGAEGLLLCFQTFTGVSKGAHQALWNSKLVFVVFHFI